MKTVKARLTATQIARLRDIVPNIHDYFDHATGELSVGCNAYQFGMRTADELRELEAKLDAPRRGSAATLHLNEVEALVLADRLEFAWEIASDNGAYGDASEARKARSYRAGVNALRSAWIKACNPLEPNGRA